MRASTAFLVRAGFVAVLAMMAVGFAGRAHAAGQSPIAFIVAQQDASISGPKTTRHFKGRSAQASGRQRMTITFASSNDGEKIIDQSPTDVVREALRWLGSGNFTGKPGAWCAWAVSAWLTATGHRPLASGMAASALSYGPRLSAPRVGALAVLSTRRGWAAHVGLVAAVHGDLVELISGNWSHRVARAVVPRWQFVAFIGV